MLSGKLKFAIPLGFVWTVLLLTLLPDLLCIAGINFGDLPWNWKSFTYTSLEYASVVTAFLIVIISFIDFRIKGDVSTPLVASTMFFSGALDLVHIMASEGLILDQGKLTFNSIYTWSFSRTFNALMLLIGAGLFLIQSDNLFRNVKMHNRKFLIYVLSLFLVITIAFIFLVSGLNDQGRQFLTPYVYSRQLDLIPLMLYLISLTLIFPKFYTNHPSIFSQTLLLSLIPSLSAQLHVVFGAAVPYDHNTMVASYEKFISYMVPFAGVAMNYLQTHFNEIRAISRFRAETNQKNQLNALLEGIMDVSLSGIIVFESLYDAKGAIRDFRCIKFNHAAMRLIDVKLTQGQLFKEIFVKDGDLFSDYAMLVEMGSSFDREVYCDRLHKWLRISSVKYRNGFVMTLIDITESKVSEDELRRREDLLSQAETIAQLGSWEMDLIHDTLVMSENMRRMFGLEPTKGVSRPQELLDILHPEDRARAFMPMEEAIQNRSDYFNEFRVIMPDGSIRYFVATGKILRDDKDVPVKCVGVTMDISSRVLANSQLRRNEILYRTFASNMPDTEVILFRDDYSIILIEGNSMQPLLRSKDALLGQDVRMVLAYFEVNVDIENLLKMSPGEKLVTIEEIENRFFRIHRLMIDGGNETANTGMILFQDITDVKKAELQLEARLNDLDRSNKELENFAYVASHDLQEPLRKITSFGDRLRMKFSDDLPEEGIDYIRRMTDATARMQRLITDLLSFSRITRLAEPFQPVDLNQLFNDLMGDIEMRISTTGAQIQVEGLATIDGVPSQLHQLFQNLLLNSLKFMKEGVPPRIIIQGKIVSRRLPERKTPVKFIRISIKDNGIGFDQQYAGRIFTLFQRLHGRHEYEGTGIGLSLCKKIAEHHNGSIEAYGKENEGAEFIVCLPMEQLRKDNHAHSLKDNLKINE